jgi:hypothetical protein
MVERSRFLLKSKEHWPEKFILTSGVVLEALATAVVATGCSGDAKDDLVEDADDKEEEEDELEVVLFCLVDTVISSSISSNSS